MKEITFELNTEDYEKLQQLASENDTTVEAIVNNLLRLCVKEQGLVVWEDGFEKPYRVLRTKEEVEEWKEKVL